MNIYPVQIGDAAGGRAVNAELHDGMSLDALMDIEDDWTGTRQDLRHRLRRAGVPIREWPESLHWDWGRKSIALESGDPDDRRIFGMRCEGRWAGAMVTLRTSNQARLAPDTGQPLVYIDFLEVAPWNWQVDRAGQRPRYSGVGSVLLGAAVAQSRAEGWGGRIGLHALPQAEAFYLKRGLSLVTVDADKDMAYFELTAERARAFGQGNHGTP